jgi:N-acetylmuramoyl-L-alanine amidase
MRSCGKRTQLVAALLLWQLASNASGQSGAAELYQEALTRERVLRKELSALRPGETAPGLVDRIRVMVVSYEDIARLFPAGEYSDNALWQGALLASDVFARWADPIDRTMALRLLNALPARFPASPYAAQVPAHVERLQRAPAAAVAARPSEPVPAGPTARPIAPVPTAAFLRGIRRELLPDVLRITLDLEREVPFSEERLLNPARVFIDLQQTQAVAALADATIPVGDDLVKQIRVGRQGDARMRIVFDLNRTGSYSVYPLYNPFRVVIDFERIPRTGAGASPRRSVQPPQAAASTAAGKPASGAAAPSAPSINAGGGFSLSRQLGLGVTRIVIDPGHGGHDPGAEAKGLTEAGLVLDVALRLERLLAKQNVDVVLTRRTNDYVPLEERTALANRIEADLFLSIHANANARGTVRGIETYFLNFAPNPEAEAIAARENAGSSRSMRELPDIVEAIAMNNKRDESRDFAAIVQAALYERLRKVNRNLKNLGVKQAPFMVLIGAGMPAILSEISFMTNSQEALLLQTERYRQQIADALFAGIMRYQEALKKKTRTPPSA